MKKIFLLLCLFLISIGQVVYAKTNQLHTVSLEKTNNSYNIVLGTDYVPKILKKNPSNDELVLELSSIVSDDTVNAMYKGKTEIDNMVIENAGFGRLKIYIKAKNIKNAEISVESKFGRNSVVPDSIPADKVLWGIFLLLVFVTVAKVSKIITEDDKKIMIKKDIKDREIELYRKYRKDLESHSIPQRNVKMSNMLKKIDRKIDERLTAAIK